MSVILGARQTAADIQIRYLNHSRDETLRLQHRVPIACVNLAKLLII